MSDSLTFRLLRYIKASAETLNFTRAAEQIFVAQSSLSHQIGKLEDNIDVAIFDRLQNGLKLTPAGQIVAAYAENTLREWDQMLVMARAVQRNEVPPLRLGFSSFINVKLMEKFREGYEGMFSGCAIQLTSGDLSSVYSDWMHERWTVRFFRCQSTRASIQFSRSHSLHWWCACDQMMSLPITHNSISVTSRRASLYSVTPNCNRPRTHVFWRCSPR